jgi:hypothetical protein
MMKLWQNTKRIFSAALVSWMSGVIVLFCCGNMPTANAASMENESCPLAKKSNCSKSSEKTEESFFKQESNAFECCAFPARIFDKVRKVEKSPESPAIVDAIEISQPKFSLIEKIYKSPKSYHSFVGNGSTTYLRNRTLRI